MLKILYEDRYITVCEKLPGMISEQNESTNSLPQLLKQQLGHEVYPLHRLDRPVGGAIMLANSKNAAAMFSVLIADNKVMKTYIAVIDGILSEANGTMKDYLYRDARKNKAFAVKKLRKGVKEAILKYQTENMTDNLSLVKIELVTGRTHQIRAQFGSRKTPVLGDGKYGSHCNKCETALWSYSLQFKHPCTGEELTVISKPPMNVYPWNLFKTENGI